MVARFAYPLPTFVAGAATIFTGCFFTANTGIAIPVGQAATTHCTLGPIRGVPTGGEV